LVREAIFVREGARGAFDVRIAARIRR